MITRPSPHARLRAFAPLAPFLLLLALLVPSTAQARTNFTVDVKAHPSVFQENTEVDVPLYLVENRAPDVDTSYFSRYPAGLREAWFDIGSVQSRFVSFTPAASFDGRGRLVDHSVSLFPDVDVHEVKIRDAGGRSRIYVRLYSLKGASATVDGSGITGRTELLLGTLRIAVGAHGPESGGQKIVLDYNVGDDASAPDPSFSWWNPPPSTSTSKDWGIVGGIGITWPRQTRVFWDGKAENEGVAPGDGAGGAPGPGGDGTGGTGAGGTGAGGPGADAGGAGGAGTGAGIGGAGGAGAGGAGAGPQAPGVSALGYSGGKLRKARKASKLPFSVLTRKPKKGTPAVKVTVTGKTQVTATLAKAGEQRKRTFSRLKGERVFTVTSLETYLKLTGSWNRKTLPKGTYRLTLRSPSGTAQTVEFKVA